MEQHCRDLHVCQSERLCDVVGDMFVTILWKYSLGKELIGYYSATENGLKNTESDGYTIHNALHAWTNLK